MARLTRVFYVVFVFYCCCCSFALAQSLSIGHTLNSLDTLFTPSVNGALDLWRDQYNNYPVVINGTKYQLNIITYNDAGDPELAAILYERLIQHDTVDVLLSPFTDVVAMPAIQLAEQYHVPIFNLGHFSLQFLPLALNWTFTVLPDITTSTDCGVVLATAGAKTALMVYDEAIGADLAPLYNFVWPQLGINVTDTGAILSNLTAGNNIDYSVLDALILKWKDSGADVWLGGFASVEMNVQLLHRMRLLRYEPNAIHIWLGNTLPSFIPATQWEGAYLLGATAFESSLNFSDPLWDSSIHYTELFEHATNNSAALSDVVTSVAATLLTTAINSAQSLDRTAVRNALMLVNISTIVGPTWFQQKSLIVSRPYYCFQTNSNGTDLVAVFPKIPSGKALIYPTPPVTYPPGFFAQLHKRNHTLRNVLIIVFCVIGSIVLVVLLVYFLIRQRFHVVMVPRNTNTEEWN